MIVLNTAYSFTGVPFLSNDVLDNYAEAVIADFAPELLKIPGKIDAEGFVEFYLGLNTVYSNSIIY